MKSKVRCTLKVADNERKNVNFPVSPICNDLSPNYIRTAYTFQKIDPSKDGWGDITIEVEVKEPITRQIPSGGMAGYQGINPLTATNEDLYDSNESDGEP